MNPPVPGRRTIKAGATDTAEDRGDSTNFFEIGPSLQCRPASAMHIDAAPLVGIGDDSRRRAGRGGGSLPSS